ncbi:MAG: DUF1062 domain-containing protein, partial [Butyricimonas faecihominis]
PELIKKDLFSKFSENDEELSWEYAFSSEIGRKNGVELDYSSVEYEIVHDGISINDILDAEGEVVAFKIKTHFEFGLKLSSVIRFCLGVSSNLLNQMIETGAVFVSEVCLLKKRKVKDGDIVFVNKEKLRNMYIFRGML